MSQKQDSFAFKIQGLDCVEEVSVLKREIGPIVGGSDRLLFDVLNGKMTVLATPEDISPEIVKRAVKATGMRADDWDPQPTGTSPQKELRLGTRMTLTIASGLFTAAGFLLHAWLAGGVQHALGSEGMGLAHSVPISARVLYGIGIVTGAWFVMPKAWFAARRLRPDMNLLMLVAVVGAVLIGEWFEAATVAFLFSVSLLLESWSVGHARRAIGALMDMTPQTAIHLLQDGTERVVAPETIGIGESFLVRAGDRIPLDGRVLKGEGEVNQAPITGESAPVRKGAGDELFAGTVNGEGTLVAECTKEYNDSTLAHIIRLVEEAQSQRAPSEQWVEQFARIYTPAVMLIATLVFLVPPLLLGGEWQDWFYRSLVLLVIACPCALVISTPVTIVAALAASARRGVLIKGGLFVEIPQRLKAIALDKTGTLTEGRPQVMDIVPMEGRTETELISMAASMESQSSHPLAIAILAHATDRNISWVPVDRYKVVPGKGAVGYVEQTEFWIGSPRYLGERGLSSESIDKKIKELADSGRTVVVVGDSQSVYGWIGLADTVRPNAKQIVAAIHAAGVSHVVMLTGDNRSTADRVASEIGIVEFQSDQLPGEKVNAIDENAVGLAANFTHFA